MQISSSHQNATSSNNITFTGNPKPEQTFQTIKLNNIQLSYKGMTFKGTRKSKLDMGNGGSV